MDALPPGIAIFLTVFAFNQLGDGLRDVFAREARGGNLGVRPVVKGTLGSTASAGLSTGGPNATAPVLSVRDLAVSFPSPDGREIDVVSGVSFDLAAGRCSPWSASPDVARPSPL